MKTYYFKVKHGFKASDFVVVQDGPDLEKALYAWMTGNIAQIGGKMINGNNIVSIEPDYHSYTGWYRSYEPTTGDDWKQIERDVPAEINHVLPEYRNRVQQLLASGQEQLIGKGEPIKILEAPKTSE
jgi:hypothetical protein